MNHRLTISCVLLGTFGLTQSVCAVAMPTWGFDRATVCERSELVIIARHLSSEDCGQPTNVLHSGLAGGDSESFERDRPVFVPVKTTFEVMACIKGSIETNRLVLFHYRMTRIPRGTDFPDRMKRALFAPSFVSFSKHLGDPNRQQIEPQRHYLLFLRKGVAGRLVPTTGLRYPEFSVYMLLRSNGKEPFPTLRKKEDRVGKAD